MSSRGTNLSGGIKYSCILVKPALGFSTVQKKDTAMTSSTVTAATKLSSARREDFDLMMALQIKS